MKSSLKNIGFFLFLIFVIIVLSLSYSLYDLQAQLAKNLEVDLEIIKQNTDVSILKLLGFFIIELFIGGLGLFYVFKEKMSKNMLDIDDLLNESHFSLSSSETHLSEENKKEDDYLDLLDDLRALEDIKDWKTYCSRVIKLVSKRLEISQGLFFLSMKNEIEGEFLEVVAGYAYYKEGEGVLRYRFGEGLAGQAAKAKKIINIKNVPEGYIQIVSGLGGATPNSLLIVPLVHQGRTIGVIELASFNRFNQHLEDVMSESVGLITQKLMVLLESDRNI